MLIDNDKKKTREISIKFFLLKVPSPSIRMNCGCALSSENSIRDLIRNVCLKKKKNCEE